MTTRSGRIAIMPSTQRLHELFVYDSASGKLYYRIKTAQRVHVGAEAGWKDDRGYRQVRADRRIYQVHRIIWKMIEGYDPYEIDHDNRIRDDNRWGNLRHVSPQQNTWNTPVRRDNRCGRKGVTRKGNRYYARIRVAGIRVGLGGYANAEDAHAAYMAAANKAFGEYASGA